MTHDIFSMIAIHSALLGPQAPQTKFEYVRDAIRTYNKDLHRKTLIPGISFSARYALRVTHFQNVIFPRVDGLKTYTNLTSILP